MTVGTLTDLRERLIAARLSGVLEFRDQNGERIVYRSDAEMARAIEAADREIARLSGTAQPRTIHFHTSKGLT
ncbi:MAG: hypothetical protein C0421_02970 [Hyphomonas sp.]|uniref:phage head-tail joining protein n=1 Tax=Hyphomonas sp. TaxID=87 RepID=UPI0025BE2668|nr:hypothetical protein [Hyphomonas sp.]MBA4337789.1 hypothetical protein [Hyphomonas sp.]